ncbi:MAG: sensor histidine kinase [Acidobacteria bacterium]|nr:sensor histidine kinase [Acidobacteriota bacterium]
MNIPDSAQSFFSTASLERRIAELTILYEVSCALQKTLDEEKALNTILAGVTAGRGLGFNRAFILLVDMKEEWLEGRLAMGPSSPEEASRMWRELRTKHQTLRELLRSLNESGIRKDLRVNEIISKFRISLADSQNSLIKIMRSREASLAGEDCFLPQNLPMDLSLSQLLGINDFAVAPLYLAERDLGLLIADNAITQNPIDIRNLRLLQIYAQEASTAIQNTRFCSELKEKIELLQSANQAIHESQEQLLRAERLSTIGRMSALLAHQIRTPLVSIGGFARRLMREISPDDPRREEMEVIYSEVGHLERLVGEVLGYSKSSDAERKSVNANALVRSIAASMKEEIDKRSIRAVMNLCPEIPDIEVNELQLRQALMNLIANAIDAMPSGGTLTFDTIADKNYIEIGVSDTGMGIKQEYWNKLFTPFFTTKEGGTGLGLAIVSQVVDNHNGSLRFESIPGQGTAFYIRLAVHPDKKSAAHLSPTSEFTGGGPL